MLLSCSECVTVRFKCQGSISVFINIFSFILRVGLAAPKPKRNKIHWLSPFAFWLWSCYVPTELENVHENAERIQYLFSDSLRSSSVALWVVGVVLFITYVDFFSLDSTHLPAYYICFCFIRCCHHFRYGELAQHANGESFLGTWKYSMVWMCFCYALTPPLNICSQNICLSEFNGILSGCILSLSFSLILSPFLLFLPVPHTHRAVSVPHSGTLWYTHNIDTSYF